MSRNWGFVCNEGDVQEAATVANAKICAKTNSNVLEILSLSLFIFFHINTNKANCKYIFYAGCRCERLCTHIYIF